MVNMPKKKRTKNGVVDSIEGGTYIRKESTGPCPVLLQDQFSPREVSPPYSGISNLVNGHAMSRSIPTLNHMHLPEYDRDSVTSSPPKEKRKSKKKTIMSFAKNLFQSSHHVDMNRVQEEHGRSRLSSHDSDCSRSSSSLTSFGTRNDSFRDRHYHSIGGRYHTLNDRPYSIAVSASNSSLRNHSVQGHYDTARPYSMPSHILEATNGGSPSLQHQPGPSYRSNWRQNRREKANQHPFRRTNTADESESQWEDSVSFTYVPQGPVFPSDPEYASEVEKIMSRSPVPVSRNCSFQDMFDYRRVSDATTTTDEESGFCGSDGKPVPTTPYAQSLGSIRNSEDISSPDLRPSVSSDDLECGQLPPYWEVRCTDTGLQYYVDHKNKVTQWEHPLMSLDDKDTEELPEGWEVVTSEQYGIYYVNHNNHTAQYQHPVHSGAPPPYGDESRKRIPPSRSHSHRNSQIHRLRNPTSSLPRRSKSLKDTPTITVQEEDGPHQLITHDHQLSTVTYVPPSPYQIAEIPQWLREYYEFAMGSSEEEMALASRRINWNSFTLEQLEGYNTMLHRLFKKDCEQLLKGLDYKKALIQKESESRAGGSHFQHDEDYQNESLSPTVEATSYFV